MKENVKKNKEYSQVCVWPGVLLEEKDVADFEEQFLKQLDTRIQYLETIKTKPDQNESGSIIEGTGGRSDVFFAVHDADIRKFAILRLEFNIHWLEDILAPINYRSPIYPERVRDYQTWPLNAEGDIIDPTDDA